MVVAVTATLPDSHSSSESRVTDTGGGVGVRESGRTSQVQTAAGDGFTPLTSSIENCDLHPSHAAAKSDSD